MACIGGHKDIITYFYFRGIFSYKPTNNAINLAIENDNLDLVKYWS